MIWKILDFVYEMLGLTFGIVLAIVFVKLVVDLLLVMGG
jgi:hypothetical protein